MRTSFSDDEIFLQKEPIQCTSDHEIQYQKSSGDNQNEYLSQFLNSEVSQNLQQIITSKSEQMRNHSNQIEEDKSFSSMHYTKNLVKTKKREKSCFHNFQKHLVITLRNVIKVQKSLKPKHIETIAYEMWTVFTKSTLYSKKFLHVLFGVYGTNQENQFSKDFLKQLGFMQIFAKYPEDEIKEAQKYLRKDIVRQLQKLNMKEYLAYRKLKRVQDFQTYIEEFLEQLREGSVRKRLPKDRKKQMANLTKKSQGSPETHV